MNGAAQPLLEIRDLRKYFRASGSGFFTGEQPPIRAVDGVSLSIERGQTFGLVGESGCGKSTLGRLIARLIEPTSGSIFFEGRDITGLSRSDMREVRRHLQIIFQDPYASLNPRMTVSDIIGEAFEIHGLARGAAKRQEVAKLLDAVGLSRAHIDKYPHEFSGGQRQRIGIARALALKPKLIICDEPVSALDVSIQSQILNLLKDLQREFGLAYLFIAHGLAAVRHISDRIGVMYLGKLVETAPSSEIFTHPAHPYTQALISAIPRPDPDAVRDRIILEGDLPSPAAPPPGCRFHTRCREASRLGTRCMTQEPAWHAAGADHLAACHLVENTGAQ